MPCRNPRRLHIHLAAFTYLLRWSLKRIECEAANLDRRLRLFLPPMRVLWSVLVMGSQSCSVWEVALSLSKRRATNKSNGEKQRGDLSITINPLGINNHVGSHGHKVRYLVRIFWPSESWNLLTIHTFPYCLPLAGWLAGSSLRNHTHTHICAFPIMQQWEPSCFTKMYPNDF